MGQAGFAWGGVSPVLLYLIELESLDLSGALDFKFYTSTGLLASTCLPQNAIVGLFPLLLVKP